MCESYTNRPPSPAGWRARPLIRDRRLRPARAPARPAPASTDLSATPPAPPSPRARPPAPYHWPATTHRRPPHHWPVSPAPLARQPRSRWPARRPPGTPAKTHRRLTISLPNYLQPVAGSSQWCAKNLKGSSIRYGTSIKKSDTRLSCRLEGNGADATWSAERIQRLQASDRTVRGAEQVRGHGLCDSLCGERRRAAAYQPQRVPAHQPQRGRCMPLRRPTRHWPQ